MTFLILSVPLGVVLGYVLTSVMVSYLNWHWSFIVQGLAILPCALSFFLTPKKYLDIEGTIKARLKCAHAIQQKLYKRLNMRMVSYATSVDAGSAVTSRRGSS